MGANPIPILILKITTQYKHMTHYKINFYSIPSRTLPLHSTNSRFATLQKSSHLINIIRSPHIDKRSWEQFQFFLKKQTMVCNSVKEINKYINAKKALQKMFAVLRIQIIKSETKKFKTQF